LERGDGIPFLGATNIKNNSVNFEDCSDIEERIHNTTLQRSKLSGGELLITMAGTIGACSVYPKSVGESNINQAIAKIILDEKRADARYVSMFLNSYYGQLQFSQNRHDVGTPNINLEEIKKIKVVLPVTIGEQEEILRRYDIYIKKTEPLLKEIEEIKNKAHSEFTDKLLNKV